METKFTPGPWSFVKNEGVGDPWFTVLSGSWDVARNQHSNRDLKTEKANAHLITAAPDLYEALIDLLAEQNGPPLIHHQESWERAMDHARSALAKARGEE